MVIPDGFGYSPDNGYFEIKDNKAYLEDGDITNFEINSPFRWMRCNTGKKYSEWSKEEREFVIEEFAKKRMEYKINKIREMDVILNNKQLEIIIKALKHYIEYLECTVITNSTISIQSVIELSNYIKDSENEWNNNYE